MPPQVEEFIDDFGAVWLQDPDTTEWILKQEDESHLEDIENARKRAPGDVERQEAQAEALQKRLAEERGKQQAREKKMMSQRTRCGGIRAGASARAMARKGEDNANEKAPTTERAAAAPTTAAQSTRADQMDNSLLEAYISGLPASASAEGLRAWLAQSASACARSEAEGDAKGAITSLSLARDGAAARGDALVACSSRAAVMALVHAVAHAGDGGVLYRGASLGCRPQVARDEDIVELRGLAKACKAERASAAAAAEGRDGEGQGGAKGTQDYFSWLEEQDTDSDVEDL